MVATSRLVAAVVLAAVAIIDYSTDIISVGTVVNAQNAMEHGYYGPALWANSIFGRAPPADDHPVPQPPPPAGTTRRVLRAHETHIIPNLHSEVLAAAGRTPAATSTVYPADKPDVCGRGEAPTSAGSAAHFGI